MTASAGRLDHLVPVIFLTVGLLGAGCKSESSSQENPEPSEHASSEPSSDQSHDAQPSEAQDREPSPAVKAVPDDEALGELEPTPPTSVPSRWPGRRRPRTSWATPNAGEKVSRRPNPTRRRPTSSRASPSRLR